jgi:ABC-type nitrate/sulfonate/bicarbonate transport system permease component
MKNATVNRSLLGLLSLATLVVAYTLISNAGRFLDLASLPPALRSALRPEVIPPTQAIAEASRALLAGPPQKSASEGHAHAGHHVHSSDHVEILLQQGVTLQESLAITSARVLFGLAVGAPLGILIGLFMGLSRRADDLLHPLYVLLRSVPPLALITYIMLWLGHSEAHRLIPIVYAVAVTLVIPAYHGARDVAGTYVVAARSLGARGWLLLTKVLLPAASPALLSGLRYALAIAWMTAVGAEMLMAENGMGNLIVGGGMWASRLQTRSDPAVVIVGIMAIAAAGWAMDTGATALTARLTRWVG